jgi:hypothetical protein
VCVCVCVCVCVVFLIKSVPSKNLIIHSFILISYIGGELDIFFPNHECAHIHIHTYIHTFINTYIHTYIKEEVMALSNKTSNLILVNTSKNEKFMIGKNIFIIIYE